VARRSRRGPGAGRTGRPRGCEGNPGRDRRSRSGPGRPRPSPGSGGVRGRSLLRRQQTRPAV